MTSTAAVATTAQKITATTVSQWATYQSRRSQR